MELIYRIQVNLMAMVVLFSLFVISRKRLDRQNPLNSAFFLTLSTLFLGLIFETATCLLNGNANPFVLVISHIMDVGLFSVSPLLSFTFLIFIHRVVLVNRKINKNVLILLLIPIAVNFILAILSPFFGFIYSIDSLGIYHRESWFILAAIITYGYLLIGVGVVIYHRKKLLKQDLWIFLLIGILPAVGGVLQVLFYGILTMWSSAAVALCLAYLYLQERMVHLDSLTGVWTRESFYNVYSRRFCTSEEDCFGAIYFDMDNLKAINDTYGHQEGDNAIMMALDLVRDSITLKDIICRLGGDEFIVIIESGSKKTLESKLAKIKQSFTAFASSKIKPYILDCSFGFDMYSNQYSSLEVFLRHLDLLMYEEKKAKRDALT